MNRLQTLTSQFLTYGRTQQEDEELLAALAEITDVDKAVRAYWYALIDKDDAESSLTARVIGTSKWSDKYKEFVRRWSQQHPDGDESDAYQTYLVHATNLMRREAEEELEEIKTWMMMLEKKFEQDIRTEALKKYNENKYNRTDVPEKQAAWQALHGNLPHKKLTRSWSWPVLPKQKP